MAFYNPSIPNPGANRTGTPQNPYKQQQDFSPTENNPGSKGAGAPVTGPNGWTYNGMTNSWVAPQAQDQTSPETKRYRQAISMLGGGGGSNYNYNSNYNGGMLPRELAPTSAPTIQPPANIERIASGPNPAGFGHIQGPDTSAADAAAFAKAKDQVGQTSRGALTGLAGAMAGRGILGSGVEGRGITNVIGQGQQQLGDVSRGLAVKNADLAEQNALASYQGDIAQRGQNISSLDTQRGQDVNQRGQDVSASESAYNTLVNQRAQDQALAGLEYQGRINQRGQDLSRLGQGSFSANGTRESDNRRIATQYALGGKY